MKTYGAHIKTEEDLKMLFAHIRRYYEIAKSLGEELEIEITLEQPKEVPEEKLN